jgi:hypothetical protein
MYPFLKKGKFNKGTTSYFSKRLASVPNIWYKKGKFNREYAILILKNLEVPLVC